MIFLILNAAICIILILFCVFLLGRNQSVALYRRSLLLRMRECHKVSILLDKKVDWEGFDQVSYDEMMWKFWRPLESFYPNEDFATLPPFEELQKDFRKQFETYRNVKTLDENRGEG